MLTPNREDRPIISVNGPSARFPPGAGAETWIALGGCTSTDRRAVTAIFIAAATTARLARIKTASHIRPICTLMPGSQIEPSSARPKATEAVIQLPTAFRDLQASRQNPPTQPSRPAPADPPLPASAHPAAAGVRTGPVHRDRRHDHHDRSAPAGRHRPGRYGPAWHRPVR